MNSELKINSQICLAPNNCYPIETKLPIWIAIIFLGATVFVIKDIIELISN